MIVKSKYTRTFHSNCMTRRKYDELYEFAVLVRSHKNIVSQFVNDNLLRYLDYSKFQFVKEMHSCYHGCISSSFYKQLYSDVYVCYQNKFSAVIKKLSFYVVDFNGFELYKKNTRKHKKGDFKRVLFKKRKTKLSACLTYLARYGNANTLRYLEQQVLVCADADKVKFYKDNIECCGKRIIRKYSEHPIEFKSLTFGGRSRKNTLLAYNKRFGSVINAFITLSGFSRKAFDIPVKFNKDWFGSMKDYNASTGNFEYLMMFDERERQVKILLCKNGDRYVPDVDSDKETVGIDVNCKHNLFSLSDGTIYDYDRRLVNDYCKCCLEVDELKSKNPDYVVGKRRQRKLDKLDKKMLKSEQQTISTMCKRLQSKNVGHIVMEDLDNSFGKCYVNDSENDNINYNRKVGFLGLSSLKNEVEHIARKYGIAVSTVQSCYTSKMCPVCGCIDDDNRLDQETFHCVECGHSDNADFNAANNIRNRVLATVLRDKLLKQQDNGSYKPRDLKKDEVKKVLLSFQRNLQQNAGSECVQSTENVLNIFSSS